MCPKTPFCFGLNWSSATDMSLLPMRIADGLGSRHKKSGRSQLHYCSVGTVPSGKF